MAGLHVSRVYKTFGPKIALNGIDLHVPQGQVVALMGANGAGKSSLYRIITGASAPDSGSVTLDGLDITTLPPHGRARCGLHYLPQEPSALRGLTVRENIALALECSDMTRAQRAEKMAALLETFGLTQLQHHKARQISGGERRRCEIARLMANRPRYVLLDEPFAGLDPIAIDQICKVILSLRAAGVGVLISDHNIHAALSVADQVQVIHAGATLAIDTPTRIVSRPELRGIWLSDSFAA